MPRKLVDASKSTQSPIAKLQALPLRKLLLLALLAVSALLVVMWMLGAITRSVSMGHRDAGEEGRSVAPTPPLDYGMPEYDMAYPSSGGTGGGMGGHAPTLSYRNIAPPGYGGTPAGDDLEAFEASDYSATFRQGNIERTCQIIEGLKSRTDVVFINAERGDTNCYYRFKVPKASSERIMSAIKALEPEEFSVHTETVKGQVTDYTSTLTILSTKLAAIESALEDAEAAYDELTVYATSQNDAETLANVINSKLAIIERLTGERLMVRGEIERVTRAKAEEIERIDHVFVSVYAFEDPVINFESIGESWRQAVRNLITIANEVFQSVTVGLVAFIFFLVPIAFYSLLILLVVKYGMRLVKKIWKY